MAEAYTTLVHRIAARLKARGVPENQALNKAEKQASAIRKRANPGTKLNKRHNFRKQKDPVPPKEKKQRRREDIKEFAKNIIMEIHGITGLIASPPVSGGLTGDPITPSPSTTGPPLSAKYNKQNNDDPSDTNKKGKSSSQGFRTSGGLKSDAARKTGKTTKSKGSMTASPATMEAIEEEFGIQ